MFELIDPVIHAGKQSCFGRTDRGKLASMTSSKATSAVGVVDSGTEGVSLGHVCV